MFCLPKTAWPPTSGSDPGGDLSLTGNDRSSQSSHCRVNDSDLPLRTRAGLFRNPFGLPLRCLAPSQARVGIMTAYPLLSVHPALPASPQLPLPFQVFRPVRIKAFHQFVAEKSTFRMRPIASRSPGPPL